MKDSMNEIMLSHSVRVGVINAKTLILRPEHPLYDRIRNPSARLKTARSPSIRSRREDSSRYAGKTFLSR
jgi:hypothetical protein